MVRRQEDQPDAFVSVRWARGGCQGGLCPPNLRRWGVRSPRAWRIQGHLLRYGGSGSIGYRDQTHCTPLNDFPGSVGHRWAGDL